MVDRPEQELGQSGEIAGRGNQEDANQAPQLARPDVKCHNAITAELDGVNVIHGRINGLQSTLVPQGCFCRQEERGLTPVQIGTPISKHLEGTCGVQL